MVHGCVVKLHIDGVILVVVVASNNPHGVPHLRHSSPLPRVKDSDLQAVIISLSYHEAVGEMGWGGARLKGFLGRRWQGAVIDGMQGHQWGSRRLHSTARIIVIPEFVLTEL